MGKYIANAQIIFLIFGGIVGLTLNVPQELGIYAGTGGWFVVVVCAAIVLIPGILILQINTYYEDRPCQYIKR